MPSTEGFTQAQTCGAFDQERGTEFGTLGDKDPAQGLGLARIVQRTGDRSRHFGVQVGEIGLGLFGTAAGRQVRDNGDQFGIVVQGSQFRLEQVLSDDETGEVGLIFERRMGFHQLIELGVRLVGDLVQALGAQAQALSVVLECHCEILENKMYFQLIHR